ncbi:MAG: hypothetical protein ACD_7C00540G0002 [uncultured bacterium]|nr:MAG: hypothetical protein ACD_7C00540G0002 [uncultured bacterium]
MREKYFCNITISGLPGAGSSTLGKLLARETGWEYYSGGDFMRAYAIEKGLFNGEKTVHHDATVYSEDFDREIDYGMRTQQGKEEGRIYDSWLSGFMAQGVGGVMKVLVHCSEDAVRVDRIVNRDGISIDEAKKHIFEREEKNGNKWARMYKDEWVKWVVNKGKIGGDEKIDFWDPRLYDLVIDTYSNSKEETLRLVLEKLKSG